MEQILQYSYGFELLQFDNVLLKILHKACRRVVGHLQPLCLWLPQKQFSEDVSIWKEQPNLHSYLEEQFQLLNKDYMED